MIVKSELPAEHHTPPAAVRTAASPAARLHAWQIPVVRELLFVLLAALVGYLVFFRYWSIFAPLIGATLLAFVFHPLVTAARVRWGIPRVVSTAIIVLLTGFAVAALLMWVGPQLVRETTDLFNRLPDYLRTLSQERGWAGQLLQEPIQSLSAQMEDSPQEMVSAVLPEAQRTARWFGRAFTTTGYALLVLIVVPVYFFVLCWRFDHLQQLREYIPQSRRRRVMHLAREMGDVFSHFFLGRLIAAAAVSALLALGLWLAGVPYWFLLAVIGGLLNIVPYAVFIAWFAVVLIKYVDAALGGGSPTFVDVLVWPTAVFLIAQAIDNWLLTPIIQAKSVNLNPVTVIVVLFIGGAAGGLIGLLLAIPVAGCIKVLMVEVVAPAARQWAAVH